VKIKKWVILSFLLFAYSIILAHNIIPHHHHVHDIHFCFQYCSEHCNHEANSQETSPYSDHTCLSYINDPEDCNTCFFSVDPYLNHSIDHIFIIAKPTGYFQNEIPSLKLKIKNRDIKIEDKFLSFIYLRAPPTPTA